MYFSMISKYLPLNQVTGPSKKSLKTYAYLAITLRGGGRSSAILTQSTSGNEEKKTMEIQLIFQCRNRKQPMDFGVFVQTIEK